jgi:hypothetical protein
VSKYIKTMLNISQKPYDIMVVNFESTPSIINSAFASIDFSTVNIVVCMSKVKFPMLLETVLEASGFESESVRDLTDNLSWDPVEAGMKILREPTKSNAKLCVWNLALKREKGLVKKVFK